MLNPKERHTFLRIMDVYHGLLTRTLKSIAPKVLTMITTVTGYADYRRKALQFSNDELLNKKGIVRYAEQSDKDSMWFKWTISSLVVVVVQKSPTIYKWFIKSVTLSKLEMNARLLGLRRR